MQKLNEVDGICQAIKELFYEALGTIYIELEEIFFAKHSELS